MRKYKQVKCKEVTYDLTEWRKIEERAASVMLKPGTFIKRMSLEGKIFSFDIREVSDVMKVLRIIEANTNQIAKKANETNNNYAADIEALRKEIENIRIITMKRLVNQILEEQANFGAPRQSDSSLIIQHILDIWFK